MLKLEIFYIIFGLCVGFFVIYITSKPPKIILKYPSIENIASDANTTYIDENNVQYKYTAKEVKCNQ